MKSKWPSKRFPRFYAGEEVLHGPTGLRLTVVRDEGIFVAVKRPIVAGVEIVVRGYENMMGYEGFSFEVFQSDLQRLESARSCH